MTQTLTLRGIVALSIAAVAVFGVAVQSALADSAAITFEPATYTLGNINGQDGWSKTGAYDVAVTSSYGVPGYATQSLRFSNAVTSGSFGDQTFSKSLTNEAGEAVAENGGMSGGTRQAKFAAEFSIRSMQLSQQPGLFMSVSPDRGDGARMSYLGFADTPDGIDVTFFDVQGTGDPANFVSTLVADNLSRATTHTARFEIDFVDGASNDVVKIYIDGALAHTGTTWENYYRFDDESNPGAPSDTSRTVDSLLFRAGGTAAPATNGLGYLIDNIMLESSGAVPPPAPVPPANACATPTVAPDGYTLQNGTLGNDNVTITSGTMFVGKGGADTVNGAAGNYIVCLSGSNDKVTLGDGNSTIDVGSGTNQVTVGNGEGTIMGTTGNDTVVAGNGARTIDVGSGTNKVTTGDGAQNITGGAGNDEIKAGAGNDTVNAGSGSNKVWGEAGDDSLTGGAGSDTIDGGANTDTCVGGAGSNTLTNCEL